MEIPHTMSTISEILNKLSVKKMDNEFRSYKNGFSVNKSKFYQPSDLVIIKVYRFEGITDPADMSVIYVIQANDGLIGYTLNSYAYYSDHENELGYHNFIRMIPVLSNDEQLLFEL